MEKELAVANNKAEDVLVTVTERARESEAVKKSVMQKKEAAEQIVKAIEVDKGVAETALEAAKPALEEAEVTLGYLCLNHVAFSTFVNPE